jgi:uncharacterized protein (DUF885 family)
MKSLIPLVAGGAAGMMWGVLPNWVKVPAVVGLVALAALELNKDLNESWFSSAIFGGQASEGEAKTVDPLKTEADAAAGKKPVSGAARMMAKQVEKTGAEAVQAEVAADADRLSEQELLAKQAKGIRLTSKESLRIQELKKLRSEAETAQAQSTAARAQAQAEKQSAEIASRIIGSMNDGTLPDTLLDLSGIRGVFPDIERLNAKRRQ